jgi:hypothetical protein
VKSPAPPFWCCSPRHILPIAADSGSGVAASLDRGNILSPGDVGFWWVTWIEALAALDGMGEGNVGWDGEGDAGWDGEGGD